jgi:hypothetical protein
LVLAFGVCGFGIWCGGDIYLHDQILAGVCRNSLTRLFGVVVGFGVVLAFGVVVVLDVQ